MLNVPSTGKMSWGNYRWRGRGPYNSVVLRVWSSASLGNMLEMCILRTHPDLLNQELQGWSPSDCVSAVPPAESGAHMPEHGSLAPSLPFARSDETSCHVVSCSIGGTHTARNWGPPTSTEWIPKQTLPQPSLWMRPQPRQTLREAAHVTLSWRKPHPVTQQLWDGLCYFKPLSSGAICYAADT